ARLLRALDALLAHFGVPPSLDLAREARAGSRVRAAYARLRTAVDDDSLDEEQALGRAAVALTALVQGEVWRDVRMGDRFLVERLLRRVLTWGAAGSLDGRQLLSDVAAAAALLERINLRGELLEHDRAHVRVALRALEAG